MDKPNDPSVDLEEEESFPASDAGRPTAAGGDTHDRTSGRASRPAPESAVPEADRPGVAEGWEDADPMER